MVFRPDDRQLPPSRGRKVLEFKPDGTVEELAPGPDDRPVKVTGTWRVTKPGTIVIASERAAIPRRILRVVELSEVVLKLS